MPVPELEPDERIGVVAELRVRSMPCQTDNPRHDLCPEELALDLWGVALLCGCECHAVG